MDQGGNIKRIGILTSGGDCPGLNAVIHSVVRASSNLGWEVIGFKNGYEGLLHPDQYMPLDRENTAGIMHLGGTILGTTNKGRFSARGRGRPAGLEADILEEASNTMQQHKIDALLAVGGDGSLTTALHLYKAGFPIIGVPKTIDNDISATQRSFGFDSAVECVRDALDRLHTTTTSHKRIMVIEVMGRHAGWIALYGGLAGGGDVILIPEIQFDISNIVEAIKRREKAGCESHMIVVAEGARPRGGKKSLRENFGGQYRLGGMGEIVSHQLSEQLKRETRTCVLGHLQRGGAPTTDDRILGVRFGVHAVEMVQQQRFGTMVSYQNDRITQVPLGEAVHRLRRIHRDSQIINTARSIGISFGDSHIPSP